MIASMFISFTDSIAALSVHCSGLLKIEFAHLIPPTLKTRVKTRTGEVHYPPFLILY